MNRIELAATAAPGTEVDLLEVNPDGTLHAFSVTAGHPFIVTGISIERETQRQEQVRLSRPGGGI
jgi:hypothetical protein